MNDATRTAAPAGHAASEAVEIGHGPSRGHNLPVASVLPVGATAFAVAGYVGILASFWLSFAADVSAALSIGVSTAYGVVFFGVPYFMLRTAAKHGHAPGRPTLSDFLHGDFETIYGRIDGWGAFVQVALIPIALAFGSLAIGFVFVWTLG